MVKETSGRLTFKSIYLIDFSLGFSMMGTGSAMIKRCGFGTTR